MRGGGPLSIFPDFTELTPLLVLVTYNRGRADERRKEQQQQRTTKYYSRSNDLAWL